MSYRTKLTMSQTNARRAYFDLVRLDKGYKQRNSSESLKLHFKRDMMINYAYNKWKGDCEDARYY